MKNCQARSFVTVMIVIAVSALLLRFTIESLIKINITQNESTASITLKLISAALENYASDNHSVYPASISVLTKTTPPYLDEDYLEHSPLKGYNYGCLRLDASGYSCYASPLKCRLSGKKVYTVTTGGLLISEECNRRE